MMKPSGILATLSLAILLAASPLRAAADDAPADGKDPDKKPGLPLELERRIEFETDEATWISLDPTPDGTAIVFDVLGDLYRLPIDGGDATRITDGAGYDSQPRLSPDGRWIAFISDRKGADNLWIAAADGSDPRRLSKETRSTVVSPAWTPDSQYVIVTRSARRTELVLYHVDGGTGVVLDGEPPGDSGGGPPGGGGGPARVGAAMAPDGRYLYFAQSATGPLARFAPFPSWQIARRDMRTGDVDVLTQAEGSAVRPALSPDGRLVVYATRYESRTGLRIRDLESGADRWLVYPVQHDEIEGRRVPTGDLFPGYGFTPDGREVVVSYDGKIHRVDVATGATTPVPFKVRVSLDVGPDLEFPYRVDEGPVRARLVQDPRLSPDGGRLAFSVLTKIYVMDLPDGEPRRLTSGDAWEFKPAFSPDGEWIAYVTWSMDGGHVWKHRADGSGEPRRLSEHPAFYTDVVFSPDGTRLVALRGNEYMRHRTFSEFGGLRIPLDLVWLSAEGGRVHLVTPARGIGAPHFADDPERIYVYSREGLMSLRYDGTDRRTHLKVTGPKSPFSREPPPAETVLLRPDGKWALAKVVNQLFVVAVPPVGGKAPTVDVRGPAVPAVRITDIGADYFGWADGGDTITWAIGSTFYRRPFDSLEFRQEKDEDGDEENGEDEDGEDENGEDEDGDDEDDEKVEDPLDLHESVEAVEIVLEFPRSVPRGTIALRHATVITMEGDAVVADADLVVTDHRITALGESGEVEIPAGARELDMSGTWIVPGFVDTHAHWEFRTHDVLEPQNWSLVANLAYGVTAGLDVQTSTNDYFAYQDLVDTGQSLGQRAFMTGPGVFSSNDFQSYEATLSYLKRYQNHYRTANLKSYMVGNRKQRQWVVKASKELGLITTTEGGSDLKLNITHAIDGFHGNEHNFPVFPIYRDVVELYARTRTAYTPTLLVLYGGPSGREYFFTTTEVHDDAKLNRFTPHNRLDEMSRRRRNWYRHDEHSFDESAAQAAKIQRAGGLVGVGGHGEVQGLGYHWEMWALAMGGMTPGEVLRAATIDGAEIIGVEQDLGSITVGKLADLVVLEKNPLEDIRHSTAIRYVMKNGELFEGETLKQLWPTERDLPSFWWWDAAPRVRESAR